MLFYRVVTVNFSASLHFQSLWRGDYRQFCFGVIELQFLIISIHFDHLDVGLYRQFSDSWLQCPTCAQVSINGVVTHTPDNRLVEIAIWNISFGGSARHSVNTLKVIIYNVSEKIQKLYLGQTYHSFPGKKWTSFFFDQKRVVTDTNESQFAQKRVVRSKMKSFVLPDVFRIRMNSFTRNLRRQKLIDTRMKLHPSNTVTDEALRIFSGSQLQTCTNPRAERLIKSSFFSVRYSTRCYCVDGILIRKRSNQAWTVAWFLDALFRCFFLQKSITQSFGG